MMSTLEESTIADFRSRLESDINMEMSDSDCLRFLRARQFDVVKSVEMAQEWWTWWNSTLPGPHSYCPRKILDQAPIDPTESIWDDCSPHLFRGQDKEGYPIYWEKTGEIGCLLPDLKVKLDYNMDECIERHVRINALTLRRIEHNATTLNKPITKTNLVLDMSNMAMTPDFFGIQFAQKCLVIDQNYYPERLNKLFVINSPWYFTAIYSLISPFINVATTNKLIILGYDYYASLLDYIDEDQIPTIYGGTMECTWNWPYHESSGISPEQLLQYANRKNQERSEKQIVEEMNY